MILKTWEIASVNHLITPDENFEITLDSPALEIFTDFKKTEPLLIEQSIDLVTAEDLMKKTHVKLKLVMDHGNFVGTLAYEDLISEKAMSRANHMKRSDIFVNEVMTPRSYLKAIQFEDVKRAKIRDIVETLQNEGKQHFLVVDGEDHCIRGIFSASDIARRLHVPINIDRVSTFIDIYKALRH
ncbi:CBS domain protein [Legionella massiliensis]|uniref:CBS domain protein n=1 Tax=Legionella massiliensis TaxID=1034943 RepID=A0A078KY92_9GAMM|nr:CBS domain-containing protein [Legionella massiliensis]CDZ76739.1 CBS domain protein [Legionella massiliensis]CEE12477.1 CBS domain protein [Legionella massiliensis]